MEHASEPVVRLTISIGQVAQMLGMAEKTFRNKRSELELLGFPKKLPGLTGYSAAAVRHWIRTNGGTYPPAAIEPALSIEIADAQRVLEQAYAS
jgi:predicted DNA-binding transcriptional regulator AlpA